MSNETKQTNKTQSKTTKEKQQIHIQRNETKQTNTNHKRRTNINITRNKTTIPKNTTTNKNTNK